MNVQREEGETKGIEMNNKKLITAIFDDSQLKATFTGIVLCGALMLAILITAGILIS